MTLKPKKKNTDKGGVSKIRAQKKALKDDYSDPMKSYPDLGITRAKDWAELHNVRPKLHSQVMSAIKTAMKENNITVVDNREGFLYEDHPRESNIRLEWRLAFHHPKKSAPHQHNVRDFTDDLKRNLRAVEGFESVGTHTGRYGKNESSFFVNLWLDKR